MDYPGKVITKTQVTPTQTSASGNWTLDDQAAAIKNNNWPVALVPNPISKSLRFNSADSAYLNRTPASAGNRQTWTWSGWVKRGTLGVSNRIFAADDGSGSTDQDYNTLFFTSSDQIKFAGNLTDFRTTTPVYRDPSAWYHIVFVTDTTQATAANRFRLYVNGVEVTAFGTSNNPSQNTDLAVNANIGHYLGAVATGPSGSYLDGYMTEVNFIDGQALTPSSFGMTNPQTGQWIPLKYSGTYGTNGFYLNFKDATSTTTLGYDYSGNANNWTTNNFSVTAGAGNDSLTDVPTPWFAYNTTGDVGGVIRGNYCTANPLDAGSGFTFTNGNLDYTNATDNRHFRCTFAMPNSGKYYWETTITASPSNHGIALIVAGTLLNQGAFASDDFRGYSNNGNKYSGAGSVAYGNSWTTNDVIGVAVDMGSGKIWFSKNGTFQASGDPAAGTNAAFTDIASTGYIWMPGVNTFAPATNSGVLNFGQRPFAYTPPTGFRSLCTTNLPATAIGFGLTNQAGKYFNPVIYTGTGSTRTVTGVGFQPDLVLFKERSEPRDPVIFDAVRGAGQYLFTNTSDVEDTATTMMSAFTSDGFTVGASSYTNANTQTYVSWNWNAGGSNATNTSGTITSTVRANTTAGFSVVTYTGNGSAGATFGHGLGVAPSWVIVKRRGASAGNWTVYSSALGATKYLYLNATSAEGTTSVFWNNTAPTSTLVTLGDDGYVNANTGTYVAYCFAAVPGYSAFGSYTGNGSADGPFVYTGFRPEFVMVKQATVSARDWIILDAARNTYNVADLQLMTNKADAESATILSSTAYLDFLSNGFKVRNTSVRNNENTAVYIYMAFAEFPFQFANAR